MGGMGRFLSRLIITASLLGLVFAGIYAWAYGQFVKPGPAMADSTVVIPHGRGVKGIAKVLERAGIIRKAMVFRLGVRFTGADKSLKAGEYVFPARTSPMEAAAILTGGKTVVRRLTIAEGLTTTQVREQLLVTDGLVGNINRYYAEGDLLPETYHFSFGDRREAIAARMAASMTAMMSRLWARRAPDFPLETPFQALVLASIVEKETGVGAERARIAGVFLNRLKKGMRLQSDPTVVYGLTEGKAPLGRALTRKDLKQVTAYNTYIIKGLPPGPICNPGRAAIAAVLNPEKTRDLYFVADGSGGHVFAQTLKEHNRNVAKWRKIKKSRTQ